MINKLIIIFHRNGNTCFQLNEALLSTLASNGMFPESFRVDRTHPSGEEPGESVCKKRQNLKD